MAVTLSIDKGIGAVTGTPNGQVGTGALTQTTEFTLTATSTAGQSATKKATVYVGNAPVINSFTVNGGAATGALVGMATSLRLMWTVTGATSVTIKRGSTDVINNPSATNGDVITSQSSATSGSVGNVVTYTLRAENQFGATETSVTVTTDAVPTVASFTTNRTAIAPASATTGNKNATLTWNVTSGGAVNGVTIAGSPVDPPNNANLALSSNMTVNPTSNRTYTLVVKTPHGAVYTHTATITVTVEAELNIGTFIADPDTIQTGGTSTLKWTGVTGGV